MAVVYAPMPKNAACPIETCPVYPVRSIKPTAAMEYMQINVSRDIMYSSNTKGSIKQHTTSVRYQKNVLGYLKSRMSS
jgi:hypothetical protein